MGGIRCHVPSAFFAFSFFFFNLFTGPAPSLDHARRVTRLRSSWSFLVSALGLGQQASRTSRLYEYNHLLRASCQVAAGLAADCGYLVPCPAPRSRYDVVGTHVPTEVGDLSETRPDTTYAPSHFSTRRQPT
jgi:hypothetical protein